MIFHNKNKPIDHSPIININNIPVNRVTDFNFLGITLDEQLTWKSHINKISAKISKSIGILYKLKHFFAFVCYENVISQPNFTTFI